MSSTLPKIQHPTFTETLPVSGISVTFRPFLTKEEKILLMAQQSSDPRDTINAINQVVNNCVVSSSKSFAVAELPVTDAAYLFLKLRARSVDNVLAFIITDGEEKIETEVDLDMIILTRDEKHTNIINLDSSLKMKMRYPTLSMIADHKGTDLTEDQEVALLKSCIEMIYNNDDVIDPATLTKEEFDEFVGEFGAPIGKQIDAFFTTMPQISYEVKYKTKAGEDKTFVLKGINDFFPLG